MILRCKSNILERQLFINKTCNLYFSFETSQLFKWLYLCTHVDSFDPLKGNDSHEYTYPESMQKTFWPHNLTNFLYPPSTQNPFLFPPTQDTRLDGVPYED